MDKKLCSLREQSVAGMVADLLRQEGLHPRPISTPGFDSGAGATQWYDVWVPEDEVERASEVLADVGYGDILTGT